MKFCPHCGQQVNENAVVCTHCGCETGNKPRLAGDAPSGGIAFLSFLFPIIGLILYVVWNNQYPLKANSAGKGALIKVIAIPVIAAILIGILSTFGTIAL